MALTPKQQRFVDEYLKDLNAAAAARRAGYSSKNARKIGHQLLGKTRLSEAIVAAKAERARRCKLSATWVIRRLRKEATAKGSPSARVRALELLGKHLGMFPDRHDVNIGPRVNIEVVEALIDARPGTVADPPSNGEPARGPACLPPQ
jgi:phage terminase small subunit